MSDNPFAEPDDDDRTVIMPRPAAATIAALQSQEPSTEDRSGFVDLPTASGSPIVAGAAPLLSLMCSLRNVMSIPDPAKLRENVVVEVRRYEQALRDARLPLEQIRTSHYVLCASLDDVVQNTPWGSRGPWADASLVSTFHGEVRSGARFFDLLTRLCRNAGAFLPVIELMYLCMSLGMQGRYRLSPRGPADLDRLREETYLVILRQRGAAEPALSPHWQGVSAPYRAPRAELPVWLAALLATGLLGFAYALISLGLNAQSDRTFEAGLSAPPRAMPVIVRIDPPKPLPMTPQPQGRGDTLAGFLQPEVRADLVSVVGDSSGSYCADRERGHVPVGKCDDRGAPAADAVARGRSTPLQPGPGPGGRLHR